MIGSRVVGLLRVAGANSIKRGVLKDLQTRNSSHAAGEPWLYRTAPTTPKWAKRGETACAVLLWWWIWWNVYHGWPHLVVNIDCVLLSNVQLAPGITVPEYKQLVPSKDLVGLYDGKPLPDPRKYTDEELGIPPQ